MNAFLQNVPIETGVPAQVAPGVWRLPLPMVTDSRHINSYLIEDGEHWCVVDCGNRGAETRAIWERFFASPLYRKGISRIILTHTHPDHSGSAAWLAKRTGVTIYLAEEELDVMDRCWRNTHNHEEALKAWLAGWGATPQQQAATVQFYQHFATGCPQILSEVHFLEPGDRLSIGGRDWVFYAGRGHTPCNFLIHQPDDQILLTGDQVLPRIVTNVSTWWGTEDNPLDSYMASLTQLKSIPVRYALPSHGEVFDDYQARCEHVLETQQRRLERIMQLLADGDKSVSELLGYLGGKAVNGPLYLLVAGQVFARLNYLQGTHQVMRVADVPEPVFRAVS